MQVNVTWNQDQLDQFAVLAPKALAYASQEAINASLKRLQLVAFQRVFDVFMVRRTESGMRFLFGGDMRVSKTTGAKSRLIGGAAAKITTWAKASSGRGYGEVEVPSIYGSVRRSLMSLFEYGGMRMPFGPESKYVAVPVK